MYGKNKLTIAIASAAILGLTTASFAQAGGNMGTAGTGAGTGTGVGTTNNAGNGTGTTGAGTSGIGAGMHGMGTMGTKKGKGKHSHHHKKTSRTKVTPGSTAGNGPGFSGAAGTGAPGQDRIGG